ncbi:MAG: CinA family nicotinamide mononucleotide deamidase-related protein [Bacteroidetes bacterium]|nr:CinA family nicotinamide mononucleotide deamidase-related protein [Bacteroidota bacterium]
MNSVIITIGDELLIGQVINTNQAYIAHKFNEIGIFVKQMSTVGDIEKEILSAFKFGWENFDFVCVTGGLGPTHDDITKKSICKFFNKKLVANKDALINIKSLLSLRNIPLSKLAIEQANIPSDFIPLKNKLGTAQGLFYQTKIKNKFKYFLAMPGVPYEMKTIIEDSFIPTYKSKFNDEVILHKTFKTTGISEANLFEKVGDAKNILKGNPKSTLAYLPSPRGTKLRITIRSKNKNSANHKLKKIEEFIKSKASSFIYTEQNLELEFIIGKILKKKNLTLSIAESCTGGYISNRVTNVAGSSNYFLQSFITYSNESKIKMLGVLKNTLNKFGSVSKQVSEQMAVGALKNSKSNYAISITGIAGPTGGSIEKPIGSAWISIADSNKVISKFYNFGNNRILFKERASQAALDLLRRVLLNLQIF